MIPKEIINHRLLWTLETINLLIPESKGFEQHRSALDKIFDMKSDIPEAVAMTEH